MSANYIRLFSQKLTAKTPGSFPFLTHYPELMLDHWYKKFEPLYLLWLGNRLFVVISDPGIANNLFVTNGAAFSSVGLFDISHSNQT